MQTRKLRRQCGGRSGKGRAIPAGTIFGKEEKKQGKWIRLGKDGKFLKKGDEGYYEIKENGSSRWDMRDQDGYTCHYNDNGNPTDPFFIEKDGAGWQTNWYGDEPAPEFMTAEEVRCVAASLYKPQTYLGR